MLFAALGFNISQTRIPLRVNKIFVLVTINTIITFLVLYFLTKSFTESNTIVPIIIYSVIVSTGGVLNFKLLFQGEYQKYFIVLVMLAASHFMIIPFVIYFNFDPFTLLSIFVVIWFIAAYLFFDKSASNEVSILEYYKVGFSAFIINSAVSLGLTGDKFIVNHYFTAEIANAYTFAWGLTAPIFYIGNMIEKYLFAEQNPGKKQLLKKGLALSFLLIVTYAVLIIFLVRFFPSVLPASISKQIFNNIFVFMISGYAFYVILHFPLNTYLFKITETKRQKTIALYFSFIIIIFLFVFYYLINSVENITYQLLLISVWSYIFILLIVKAIIIFRNKDDKSVLLPESNANNFQEIP